MVAAMATITGPVEGLSEISRMAAEAVEGWLREYEGYRGLLIFTDEDGQRSHVMTLWDSAEAEERARAARGAMRDQIAAQTGMSTESFGVYDVPVCEVVREDDAGRL